MDKHQSIRIVIGVVFLYVIISNAFSLINKISSLIIQGISKESIYAFLLQYGLWIVVVTMIVCMFYYKYNSISDDMASDFMKSRIIFSTSILVIVSSIITLSGMLPLFVINGVQSYKMLSHIEEDIRLVYQRTLISHLFSVVIMVGQLLFGIGLLKYSKKQLV